MEAKDIIRPVKWAHNKIGKKRSGYVWLTIYAAGKVSLAVLNNGGDFELGTREAAGEIKDESGTLASDVQGGGEFLYEEVGAPALDEMTNGADLSMPKVEIPSIDFNGGDDTEAPGSELFTIDLGGEFARCESGTYGLGAGVQGALKRALDDATTGELDSYAAGRIPDIAERFSSIQQAASTGLAQEVIVIC